VRLDIVIAPGCSGCDEARAVACTLREQLPALHVNLIELDGRRPPPDRVVATPTYLLDGAVVSLGNPRASELIRMIQRRASAPRPTPPHPRPGTRHPVPGTRPARRRWHPPWRRRTA
jgi:hypothetical protein